MGLRKGLLSGAVLTALVNVIPGSGSAQQSATPQYNYSTPMPPGVASPDTVETRFGTLHFFDGFPDKTSTEKLYDNLDFQRARRTFSPCPR